MVDVSSTHKSPTKQAAFRASLRSHARAHAQRLKRDYERKLNMHETPKQTITVKTPHKTAGSNLAGGRHVSKWQPLAE